ncbi:uncharacterized protein [Narcine bancroftii]|uniref:uncharacterized protein isoform X3 n=1 Tax=Narcine bancroftii TaxID=1343680 RepID=UPI0038322041
MALSTLKIALLFTLPSFTGTRESLRKVHQLHNFCRKGKLYGVEGPRTILPIFRHLALAPDLHSKNWRSDKLDDHN